MRTPATVAAGAAALRAGFTLLEVVVAVSIGGVVVSSAVALLLALDGRAEAIREAAIAADRDANSERVLRELARNLYVDGALSPPLEGSRRSVRFRSWCAAAKGGVDPCAVRLAIVARGVGEVVVAEIQPDRPSRDLPDAISVSLMPADADSRFVFLESAAGGGVWVENWGRPLVPPAFGLVRGGDTLILRVR